MKKIELFVFIIFFFWVNSVLSQPIIKGTVEINMQTGLFTCSFQLSNLPPLSSYKILLNKGMNIKYFKDADGTLINYSGYHNGEIKGEAIEYSFVGENDQELNLPSNFEITYKGAYPVYSNDFNPFDYKGVIAFNEKTLRAADQSKWYPVIYDVKNDKLLDNYVYDINFIVKNENENSIFINGSSPQKANKYRFTSTKSYPLLIFVGTYDFVSDNGNYILNTKVDQEIAEKIFKNIETIKAALAQDLNKEFTDNIYLISHTPINKQKKGSSWGFNVYPAFAFTGLDFTKLIGENGKFVPETLRFFSHEFAHNYFSSNMASGDLKWFWLESFPEYLSYKVYEQLVGKNFLEEQLEPRLNYIDDEEFVPLSEVSESSQINDKYRYFLGPLLIQCFEDQFGEKRTNLTLQYLLDFADNEILTIHSWQKAAIISGISEEEFEDFESRFISSENFKQNIIEEIRKNHS